jgi:hypothetical protein
MDSEEKLAKEDNSYQQTPLVQQPSEVSHQTVENQTSNPSTSSEIYQKELLILKDIKATVEVIIALKNTIDQLIQMTQKNLKIQMDINRMSRSSL